MSLIVTNLGEIGADLQDANFSVLGNAPVPSDLQAKKPIALDKQRPTSLPIFQYTGTLKVQFSSTISELVPRSSRHQAFGLLTLEYYSHHESLLIVKYFVKGSLPIVFSFSHMASLLHAENLPKSRLAAELSLTMRTMRKNLSPPVAIEAVNFVQRWKK